MTLVRFSKSLAPVCLLAGLLIVTRPIPAIAQVTNPTAAPASSPAEVAGATNFQRLDPNFASAGVTTAEAFATLKKLGFRTVINLRAPSEAGADVEGEANTVKAAGLQYFNLPFSLATPDKSAVDKFLEIVKESGNQPVYIHCFSGQRANAFWLIKRLVVDGWPQEKALGEADALKMTNARLREFALDYAKEHK